MSAREEILSAIRRATEGSDRAGIERAFGRKCASPEPNLIPARGRGSTAELIPRFVSEAGAAGATVASVKSGGEIPGAVAAYLAGHGFGNRIKAAPALDHLPWPGQADLTVDFGPARGQDSVAISRAFAGITETGTLMTLSGPETPMTLNFLPDVHILVLAEARIVGAYEDAWALLRAEKQGGSFMPRAVNWITGPSRSADIELVLLLGVHGPRRLHILLVDGEET